MGLVFRLGGGGLFYGVLCQKVSQKLPVPNPTRISGSMGQCRTNREMQPSIRGQVLLKLSGNRLAHEKSQSENRNYHQRPAAGRQNSQSSSDVEHHSYASKMSHKQGPPTLPHSLSRHFTIVMFIVACMQIIMFIVASISSEQIVNTQRACP